MERNIRQFWISVPLLLIGVLLICFVLYNIAKEHKRTTKIDQEIAKHEEVVAEISGENDLLRKTISYLKSEEAQKFNAQKLGYQSEDQNVVSVRDADALEASIVEDLNRAQEASSVPKVEPQEHWRVWWRVFF